VQIWTFILASLYTESGSLNSTPGGDGEMLPRVKTGTKSDIVLGEMNYRHRQNRMCARTLWLHTSRATMHVQSRVEYLEGDFKHAGLGTA